MPGDNSGAEGREHVAQCNVFCEYADSAVVDPDFGTCPNGCPVDHPCNCEDLRERAAWNAAEGLAAIWPDRGDDA